LARIDVVGLSLLTLAPGQTGGSEVYARELVRSLARVGGLSYRVVVPTSASELADGEGARVLELPRSRPLQFLLATGPTARRALAGCTVVHYPLTVELPPPRVPAVVTLHDVQHRDLPTNFSRATRAYRSIAYDRGARRVARVIVLSDFARGRAILQLGLDPERVRVVWSGVDHERFRPSDDAPEPFVLYPARAWPHKNHRRLIEAMQLVWRDRPELRLVLTGGGFDGPLPDRVDRRGRVSDDELALLYRRASALVFPSLYEGFGQPPLEAMASGCPVAAANAGALPEICGDAALLFDPLDPEAIADAIVDVVDDRPSWRARGLERAGLFSWDATARATDAVYSELLQ
jgi:glycosyltransferase involved in cell wall biosynthesis